VRNRYIYILSTELAERATQRSTYHRTVEQEDQQLSERLTTLAGRLLFTQLPADRAEQVMGDVRAVLAHYEDDGVVRLPAAAWVVTARRP
jgi:hypothetical protein